MILGVCILREEELLDKLLQKLTAKDIHNITVLTGEYYAKESKMKRKNTNIFSSMRYIMGYYADESRVLLIPISNEKEQQVLEVITHTLPTHQYIFMTLPIQNLHGELE